MYKIGIAGADTPQAGELIRILVNHPDVDITCLYAPARKGLHADSVHHGLIGEQRLTFTDTLAADNLDFLFILDKTINAASLPAELKWVDMRPDAYDIATEDAVFGLSEAFRKPLVRGALHAVLPNPVASALLIALNPLALNLMIGGDIDVKVALPDSAPGAEVDTREFLRQAARQIEDVLPKIQKSFNAKVNIERMEDSGSDRAMRMYIILPMTMEVDDVAPRYEEVYDDHNFTFLTGKVIDNKEVEGTNKCILRLSRSDAAHMCIDVLVDPTMRGGAGEAVHLMNLLCGLHEKTGLALKSVSV
ncbi:MAG: hypothetical protein NC328_03375 [Muribaculum sp.]|nr:hypothetical protein [Muribaculum sp.]